MEATALVQLRILRPGLLQYRDVGVGVSPERKEILVGNLCLGLVSRQHVGSAQLQVCQCADGIADHGPAVIKNFLEFDDGFGALPRSQIRLAAHINWIEGPEESIDRATWLAQLMRNGDLEQFDRLCRLTAVQQQKRAHGWKV